MLDADDPAADQSATGPDGPPPETSTEAPAEESADAALKTTAKKAPAKNSAKKTTKSAAKKTAKKTAAKKTAKKTTAAKKAADEAAAPAQVPLFQPPEKVAAPPRTKAAESPASERPSDESQTPQGDDDGDGEAGARRRRKRGGRRRRKPDTEDGGSSPAGTDGDTDSKSGGEKGEKDGADGESTASRRRRRRRRTGEDGDGGGDDPQNTVTRVRKSRSPEDEITSLTGSTRLEAKKQRRREGREAGRRRAPIVSEAEFLARREAVDRVMVIRQHEDLTQIAVLEDKVLVEHYVARESQTSLIGNVYLGRVQNVLPSMEAAFIDIGKGRNAVLYAGEVNWDALGGKSGQARKIESVLTSGQSVMVQVTKDPIGHKGARLTSQISLPGRFLVYVPDGNNSGISRKLPDTERNRLKTLLKEIVPDSAGVIVRTAAEGTSEQELTRDVERLTARWDDIAAKASGKSPQLLYAEPDLTLKVVRDLFTEDFARLVVSGSDAWDMVDSYVEHVAPDLAERLERYDEAGGDVFAAYRIDEQIAKALDRKVWLPSGGSLIIDRSEAMTVVDVNTGKFTGSGGNLEETVTRNNLEAAEEMVRQLRLRDIGGIIVVDFIDMVLESNRDLVLRRLVECLGRDRTRHQVAEVTSLGLVQMTRKRIGTGLLEAFSETCEHCQGRGLLVQHEPVEPKSDDDGRGRRGGRGRGRRGGGSDTSAVIHRPSPKDVAAIARAENADKPPLDEEQTDATDAAAKDASAEAVEEQPDAEGAVAETETPSPEPPATEQPPAEAPESAASDSPGPTDQVSPETAVPGQTAPQDGAPDAPDEVAAPRVVTSVRRRGAASRPAGPPVRADAGLSSDGAAPTIQAHVPVKRKGSRKR